MNRSASSPKAAPSVRLRAVAIPAEHGGWSFVLEPIILGLLVAPSLPGLCLGIGVFGAFLARHPLKLFLSDRRRGKWLARTPVAARFTLIYGAVAALGLALALIWGSLTSLIPLLLALPLFALQAYFDATNQNRALAAELIGAGALAAAAAGIALAGGWSPLKAYPLWLLLAARGLPSVLYVRARLRLERNQPFGRALPLLAHALALAVVIGLTLAALTPALSIAALMVLLLRMIYGLSPYRRGHAAKQVGVQEVLIGVVVIALFALGYRGW